MSDTPTILLVGHCIPDNFLLKRAVGKAISGATIKKINSAKALDEYLPNANLLLINRVLDGRFEDADGLAMIERLASSVPCILISNFDDAQQAAEQAGAHPGFGKSRLGAADSHEKMHQALGLATSE
jgi:hypothetical protein